MKMSVPGDAHLPVDERDVSFTRHEEERGMGSLFDKGEKNKRE